MKVKGQILICTAIMLNDHSNPYIESTTVLSDNENNLCINYVVNVMVCFNKIHEEGRGQRQP